MTHSIVHMFVLGNHRFTLSFISTSTYTRQAAGVVRFHVFTPPLTPECVLVQVRVPVGS